MRLGRAVVLLLVAIAGCVHSDTRDCGDGMLCPLATTCERYPQFGTPDPLPLCVPDKQIGQCDGKTEGQGCGDSAGNDVDPVTQCYSGACLPAGCGNRIVDAGEVCDDGNRNDGDHCSADCTSLEVCGNHIVDRGETCDDGNLRSRDGCSSACQTEQLTWTVPASPGNLGMRLGLGLAYDTARDVTLLFGGDTDDADAGELWEFDGHAFTPHPITGPHGRNDPAFAYDPIRRVAVLYGDTQTHDTWEWDGAAWRAPAPAVDPGTREDAAFAWDPRLRALVLFGGYSKAANGQLADTWTWDGAAWTPLAATAPVVVSPELAYDYARDVLVLTGIVDGVRAVLEMGADGQWHAAPSTFGSPPTGAGTQKFAWDPIARATVLSTSNTGGAFSTWNGLGWTAISGAFASGGQVALATRTATGQLEAYNNGMMFAHANATDQWPQLSQSALEPPSALGGSAALDPIRRRIVTFGGTVADKGVWLWQGGWLQEQFEAATDLSFSAAAYDPVRDVFVLQRRGETWTLDGETLRVWTKLSPVHQPSSRTSAAMVYDAARGRVVLFGGVDDATSLEVNDTWTWDGADWALAEAGGDAATLPRPRSASLAYDPIRARVVMAGIRIAYSGDVMTVDTWEWDGAAWTEITPPVSPEDQRTHLAWDGGIRRVVLVGESGLRDTWAFDGATWTELAVAVPLPAGQVAYHLLPDPSGAGVMMLQAAGVSQSFDARLRYESDREETCTVADLDLDLDGDGLRGCADPDCTFACAPLCVEAAGCTSTRCGDGTCDARFETPRSCPADCRAADICGDLACTGDEATSCPGDCHD